MRVLALLAVLALSLDQGQALVMRRGHCGHEDTDSSSVAPASTADAAYNYLKSTPITTSTRVHKTPGSGPFFNTTRSGSRPSRTSGVVVLPTSSVSTSSKSKGVVAPASTSSSPLTSASPVNVPDAVWQPGSGLAWNYQLSVTVDATTPKSNFDVWDIDLFETSVETISSLQAQGAKVICYFSAGSCDDWSPDKASFPADSLGNGIDGWPGQLWVNISDPTVQSIMAARLALAASKGCDGVDPDNMDGYNNDSGLGLGPQDSIDYMSFLTGVAHGHELAIGLKNAVDIVPHVVDIVQWSVNEQCMEYNQCDTLAPFISQNKPVFHVEYPKGSDTSNTQAVSGSAKSDACNVPVSGFSTIIKNINLDNWIETCSGQTAVTG